MHRLLVQIVSGFASCMVSMCVTVPVRKKKYSHKPIRGRLLQRGLVTGSYHKQEVQKHQELDYLGKGHQLLSLVFNNASA